MMSATMLEFVPTVWRCGHRRDPPRPRIAHGVANVVVLKLFLPQRCDRRRDDFDQLNGMHLGADPR